MEVYLKALDEYYKKGFIEDETGYKINLNVAIDKKEGLFIYNLIKDNSFKKTLEIGCASGVSSVFICSALNQYNSKHIIIDPNQSKEYHSIGINLLKKLGLNNFVFIEEKSEIALPNLLTQGHRIDFALIDGWHTFDHTLIDFFYIDKLLNVNGIVVIDDVHLPAIKKIIRYISNYQNYQIIDSVKSKQSISRYLLNFSKSTLNIFSNFLGKRIKSEFFDSSVYKNDKSLKLYSSMIALKKIGEDKREWNWYEPF